MGIVAMVAEERGVRHLLDELLSFEGCGVTVLPALYFCWQGETLSFYQLAKRARLVSDAIVIGYQRRHSMEKVILNPDKSDEREWSEYDLALLFRSDDLKA